MIIKTSLQTLEKALVETNNKYENNIIFNITICIVSL